jgi:toxin-antitoxin system PIN domain toxin
MTYLPDVNLWIALTVAEHVCHKAAMEWIEAAGSDTIALCRVTQMGFLRLLTNSRVMAGDVFTADRAWRLMERIRDDDRVVFVSEPPGLEPVWLTMTGYHKTGANFWTDTYLAAFAEVTGYRLVTFDQGFAKYKKLSVQILGRAES